jgi:hypothetical protein
MKTENKPVDNFAKEIERVLALEYRRRHSEAIKRGLRAKKKLSPPNN